jgi:hypothetical protein
MQCNRTAVLLTASTLKSEIEIPYRWIPDGADTADGTVVICCAAAETGTGLPALRLTANEAASVITSQNSVQLLY